MRDTKVCPSCKTEGRITAEECEDDEYGDAYQASVCSACGWRSDDPEVEIARANEPNCEGCRLPIRGGDYVFRYADDVVTHQTCPTRAMA